jgi:septal ring factor EnvC (AmiA/AmiB activator)
MMIIAVIAGTMSLTFYKKQNTMQSPIKVFLTIFAAFLLTACNNLSNEVENKLQQLKSKTESLDSLINKEVEKVSTLDSLINGESDKVKKLDSLINTNSSRLDSIVKEKVTIFK